MFFYDYMKQRSEGKTTCCRCWWCCCCWPRSRRESSTHFLCVVVSIDPIWILTYFYVPFSFERSRALLRRCCLCFDKQSRLTVCCVYAAPRVLFMNIDTVRIREPARENRTCLRSCFSLNLRMIFNQYFQTRWGLEMWSSCQVCGLWPDHSETGTELYDSGTKVELTNR